MFFIYPNQGELMNLKNNANYMFALKLYRFQNMIV